MHTHTHRGASKHKCIWEKSKLPVHKKFQSAYIWLVRFGFLKLCFHTHKDFCVGLFTENNWTLSVQHIHLQWKGTALKKKKRQRRPNYWFYLEDSTIKGSTCLSKWVKFYLLVYIQMFFKQFILKLACYHWTPQFQTSLSDTDLHQCQSDIHLLLCSPARTLGVTMLVMF